MLWDYLSMEIVDYNKFKKLSKDLNGIFTLRDLEVLLGKNSKTSFYKELNYFLDIKELIKIKRSLYVTKDASLYNIANRINPESYVSTGSVLAKNLIIGSVPKMKVQAIIVGRPKIFTSELGTIEFLSIKKSLFFGYNKKDSIFWATPEKAFLDSCYFYYKGKNFSFNLVDDVNFEILNFSLIKKYLKKYDKRFISYFNKRWNE